MNEFWASTLEDTVRTSGRLARGSRRVRDVTDWLSCSEEGPTSSAQGTLNIPFQRWFHFKEAYSPKFVADTLGSLPYRVNTCIDPFGGSGTTAVTCRMLGINSTTIEINPYLADLIKAKLTPIAPSDFQRAYEHTMTSLRINKGDRLLLSGMPLTMTEPGVGERYIFPREVFATARAIARASSKLEGAHRAQEGADQLADYMDREVRHSNSSAPKGYLVVFDARRKGVSGATDALKATDAMHFATKDIAYNPDYSQTRTDFAAAIRYFMRPRQSCFASA